MIRRLALIATAALISATTMFGQSAPCPVASARTATPAETAYAEGNYPKAEELYAQAFVQRPHDEELAAGLARTRLREGEIAQASGGVNSILPKFQRSAAILTALAEVQLRQGQPWLAMESLHLAAASDPCYARTHLIRSRVLRIDSMYASERKEIQSAYDIDPTNPEIQLAWARSASPARDIASIQQYLASSNKLDPEVQKMAAASVHSLMPLLSENSQTCQVQPALTSASLSLLPSMQDGKHIDGYRLQVQLPQSRATLQVDTAASGLYISRALADANGLRQGEGAPAGTVHADVVHIGPLEFRDCTIGVSEDGFAGKGDGFIGTDIFASYLITLDYVQAKLILAELPPQTGSVPDDRSDASELRDYVPVYHRLQYLMVPVLLNNKERRLFILDSGIRYSTMASEVAHGISATRMNFTNPVQSTSGATLQVYRDSFNFEFANLFLRNQSHILELDTSAIEQNAGLKLGGMLGFDMLHAMTMHLDYRDGLVKLESASAEVSQPHNTANGSSVAASATSNSVCQNLENADQPISSTIDAVSTGMWDSGHMKAGEPIYAKVAQEWIAPSCTLPQGANLYGHVTAVSKNSSGAQLAIEFDHGDCFGQSKKELALKIIALVADSAEFKGLHNAMPTQVRGSGRQMQATVAAMGQAHDQNLNPGGTLNSVHPGIVLGIPNLKLDPQGGPACSTLMTSVDHSVRLRLGTEFIVVLEVAAQ